MGYRSNVAIALHKTTEVKLRLTNRNKVVELLEEADEKVKHSHSTTYIFSGIKWYSSFPEIKEMEDYLCSLKDKEFGFARVGEDDNDRETSGNAYDYGVGGHVHS